MPGQGVEQDADQFSVHFLSPAQDAGIQHQISILIQIILESPGFPVTAVDLPQQNSFISLLSVHPEPRGSGRCHKCRHPRRCGYLSAE